MIDRNGAEFAITEALEYDKPETEDEAFEVAITALHEYIDNGLIYTHDILTLWDGSTHPEVDFSGHDDIMQALTESTYFQLREDWFDVAGDAVRAYLEARDEEDNG